MKLIDQLYDIMTNEEFTPHQRKEQAAIALAEAEQAPMPNVEDKHKLILAIDRCIGAHPVPGSVRLGLASLCGNG